MKHTRRIASLLLALVMVFAMATTAFAATITINNGAEGSVYSAFKLLNATDGGDGKFAYTLNDKYTDVLQEVTEKTEQADVVAYIAALNADGLRTFADEVYAKVKSMTPDAVTTDELADTEFIEANTKNVFEGVDQGYYLIVETGLGSWGENAGTDTYSLVMLDTAGNSDVTVDTKENKPSVEKKVQEKNDSTGTTSWGDSADYDIGDEIPFEITGTVSSKYANYTAYWYTFSDTMDDGLSLKTTTTPADYAESIVVKIGDDDVTSQFDITATEHGFTAKANLKALENVAIAADTEVVVTYTAILNTNAVSGTAGNKNEVTLKYQNDPYRNDEGTPGETPKDINIVFTFDAIVKKVDQNQNALSGAGFTLYKYNQASSDWVAVGNEITGVTTFNFNGLDVGKYKLEETTVPAGYNKADDVVFEIVAEYDTTKDPDELIGLKVKNADGTVISEDNEETVEINEKSFNATVSSGEVETTVVNNQGSELPSTGGMGTTLFYVIGGLMVLAAVVLLVTKKRMASAE